MSHKKITVAVSGGFDPIHVGHLRMFQEAKKLGDRLIVFVNSDRFLEEKKGRGFMSVQDRIEIIKAFECVDDAIEVIDQDQSVCATLAHHKPAIFANGGDRKADNIPEYQVCEDLGIQMIFNVGGEKIRSSSELLEQYQGNTLGN